MFAEIDRAADRKIADAKRVFECNAAKAEEQAAEARVMGSGVLTPGQKSELVEEIHAESKKALAKLDADGGEDDDAAAEKKAEEDAKAGSAKAGSTEAKKVFGEVDKMRGLDAKSKAKIKADVAKAGAKLAQEAKDTHDAKVARTGA
eukprot:g5031.t1